MFLKDAAEGGKGANSVAVFMPVLVAGKMDMSVFSLDK